MGDSLTDREKISYLKLTMGRLSDDGAFQNLQSTNWRLDGDDVGLFLSENGHGALLSDDGVPLLPSQDFGESSIWRSNDNESSSSLASLFSPPTHMMHRGSFHDAKMKASSENKWLLVNVQSMEEFSSHLLNRDVWSNETLVDMIQPSFIFWQVNHDAEEGMKVCTFYKLDSLPAILVVDPITGKKKRSWTDVRDADILFEDLLPFMDEGPKKHYGGLCHGVTKLGFKESTNYTDKEGGDQKASFEYLSLPEEPKGEEEVICRVAIRLPDGRRLQRNFLRGDPIKLLWSFCSSRMEEANGRWFAFMQPLPGGSKKLEYESNLTFEESGLSNSLVSMVWM